MGGGTKEMSGMAFAGGMVVAFIVDLTGIVIPILGTIFIALMKLSWWVAGYDMQKTTAISVSNGIIELLPIVPGCMVFMGLSYRQNKKNCKKRKKQEAGAGAMGGAVANYIRNRNESRGSYTRKQMDESEKNYFNNQSQKRREESAKNTNPSNRSREWVNGKLVNDTERF